MSRPKQNALEQVKAKQKAKAAAEHAEAAERRGGGTLRRLDVSNSKKIGIVQRKGRLRANGERKGQRELRRMTCYLSPDMGTKLDIAAATTGHTKSDLIEAALDQLLTKIAV